jgi:hypothetical protein
MRDFIVLAIGALFGLGATVTAAVAPSYVNLPAWAVHWLFWSGIALMALTAVDAPLVLLWRPQLTAALCFNGGLLLVAAAAISQTSPRVVIARGAGQQSLQIIVGKDVPYETVEAAGVNRRRTIRVKVENNTSTAVSNGALRAINLDPPYRNQTEFLLKSDIAIPAHGHVFVDVAYYDEGSSQGRRSDFMYLVAPTGAFFAEAIPALPITTPHTFHLKLSTIESGLFVEIYCRLFVDTDHILHIENLGNSENHVEQSKSSHEISLQNAAVRLYEAAEEHRFLDFLVGIDDSSDKRLEHVKHLLIVDERINLSGIRSPSTKPRQIPRDELTYEMFPGVGSTVIDIHSNEIVWHGVSMPVGSLNVVIADFIEHIKKTGKQRC